MRKLQIVFADYGLGVPKYTRKVRLPRISGGRDELFNKRSEDRKAPIFKRTDLAVKCISASNKIVDHDLTSTLP